MQLTLKEEIRACHSCELHKVGNGPVPYFGKPGDVMVIGEAPGRREDEKQVPFVGPAGKLLWEELAKVGIDKKQVMRANAVCCFPDGTPTYDERYACRGHLYAQVKHCSPKIILALGRTINASFSNKAPMGQLHGNMYELGWFRNNAGDWINIFPTWHPAAILRNRLLMRAWRVDLKSFARKALE